MHRLFSACANLSFEISNLKFAILSILQAVSVASLADRPISRFHFVESAHCPVRLRSRSLAHRRPELRSPKSSSIRTRYNQHLRSSGMALFPLLFAAFRTAANVCAIAPLHCGPRWPLPRRLAFKVLVAMRTITHVHMGRGEHILPRRPSGGSWPALLGVAVFGRMQSKAPLPNNCFHSLCRICESRKNFLPIYCDGQCWLSRLGPALAR